MKARSIREHMQKVGDWVNWDSTCDQFLFGDLDATVTGIVVSWMPTFSALKMCVKLGYNVFVTHEPLYIASLVELGGATATQSKGDRTDRTDRGSRLSPDDAWVRKRKWLEEKDIIVYRCHDFWDDFPDIGIHGAWADWLGFDDRPIVERKYYELHDIGEITLDELAKMIAHKVSTLGQEAVSVIGDPHKRVSRIAVGTGAITDYRIMCEMGADVLLVTDDGTRLWESGQWSLDSGVPLIIVNHSTSEEPGMKTLVNYLKESFPGVPIKYIPVGCIYRIVSGVVA